MASSVLVPQNVIPGGMAETFEACNVDGNYFLNSSAKFFIHVKNTNASQKTVHIDAPGQCSQGFNHDADVVIPATNGDKLIGPFDVSRFNDSSNYVQLTYTEGITDLTIALLKLG